MEERTGPLLGSRWLVGRLVVSWVATYLIYSGIGGILMSTYGLFI